MRECSEKSNGVGKGSKNNMWKPLKRLRMTSLGKTVLLGPSFLQICENLSRGMQHRCVFLCFRKQKFAGGCILAQQEKNFLQITHVVQPKNELSLNAVNSALAEGVEEEMPALRGRPAISSLRSPFLWHPVNHSPCDSLSAPRTSHTWWGISRPIQSLKSTIHAVVLLDCWVRFNIFDSLFFLGPYTSTFRMFL